MKPQHVERNVLTLGSLETRQCYISDKKRANIMNLLRSTLYSQPVLAVLREYATNGWDAHQRAGIEGTPLTIHLPTDRDPTLIIRDYGYGLSNEGVFTHLLGYGETDKDDSDEENGTFGIGSKSGWAYNDTYTITSHHEGVKRVYVAVIDETNEGQITRLMDEPTCETGIEIKVPVKPKDIPLFYEAAKKLFWAFYPQPNINTAIPTPTGRGYDSGFVNRTGEGWYAIMGCVPYRINPDAVFANVDEAEKEKYDKVQRMLKNGSGGLYFDIGEVGIAGNREDLNYTESTREAVYRKMNNLLDEIIREVETYDRGGDWWQRRLKIRDTLHSLGVQVVSHPLGKGKVKIIPDPTEKKNGKQQSLPTDGKVPVKVSAAPDDVDFDPGPNFVLSRLETTYAKETLRMSRDHFVVVDSRTKIIVQDKKPRTLRGYFPDVNQYSNLSPTYWVRPKGDASVKAVIRDLEARLADAKLTGVPIIKLSEMEYHPVSKGSRDDKHKAQGFRLTSFHTYFHRDWGHKASDNWEVAEEPATAEDVYVIIDRFLAFHNEKWFDEANRVLAFAQENGQPVPTIYGFKDTERKPFDRSSTLARPYQEWKQEMLSAVMEAKKEAFIEAQRIENIVSESPFYSLETARKFQKLVARRLPADHFLQEPARIWLEAFEAHESGDLVKIKTPEEREFAEKALEGIDFPDPPCAYRLYRLHKVEKTYPLMERLGSLSRYDYEKHVEMMALYESYRKHNRPVTYAQDTEED